MAAGARTSWRPTLAWVVVVLALIVVSCSGDDAHGQEEPAAPTTSGRESPADPRLDEIADEIGCSATKPFEGHGEVTGVLMCAIDDETTTRVHTFEVSDRTEVERRFSEAFRDAGTGGVECDGDTYRYVVLGDDWLVATTDRVVAGELVVSLRAELVVPDGKRSPPSGARDACR